MNSICNGNGERETDPQRIQNVFLDFYKGLLGNTPDLLRPLDDSVMHQGPTLSVEQQQVLIAPIQASKVKDALFSIDNEKAP